MAYPYQNYPYPQPVPDRLAQLQFQQMQAQQMPQMQQMPQFPQANQGLLWVSGEVGAKSYLMAPGTTVLLMDSEAQRFYLKSTDGAGMPSLRTFEYKEVVPNGTESSQTLPEDLDNKYVTRTEYEDLRAQYESIIDKLNSVFTPETKSTRSRAKGVSEDE